MRSNRGPQTSRQARDDTRRDFVSTALAARQCWASGKERLDSCMDLVPDAAEGCKSFRFVARDSSRVFKAPINPFSAGWKYRTGFSSIVADGNAIVEVLTGEFVDGFGAVVRNIDSDVLHHGDCFRPHDARPGAGG